jgi:hypothetical protein
MRRSLRRVQVKPAAQSRTMTHEFDWMVDQWTGASPEMKLQLVLAKIRQEEKLSDSPAKRIG